MRSPYLRQRHHRKTEVTDRPRGLNSDGVLVFAVRMSRPLSSIAPAWWDYTTLDRDLISDAARLTSEDMRQLARPGFRIVFYDTLEEFYLAEALEYVEAGDGGRARGHLRADRTDRAASARRPPRQCARRAVAGLALLGHG
jgi:hypothetical protein